MMFKVQLRSALTRFFRVFSVDRALSGEYDALHHVPRAINVINAT
jgi:hypothetical protein